MTKHLGDKPVTDVVEALLCNTVRTGSKIMQYCFISSLVHEVFQGESHIIICLSSQRVWLWWYVRLSYTMISHRIWLWISLASRSYWIRHQPDDFTGVETSLKNHAISNSMFCVAFCMSTLSWSFSIHLGTSLSWHNFKRSWWTISMPFLFYTKLVILSQLLHMELSILGIHQPSLCYLTWIQYHLS